MVFKKKKGKAEEEMYQGMDEEDLPEEELEELEKIEKAPAKKKEVMKPSKEIEPTPRFIAFRNLERIGIMDYETKEIIAEGEFAILQALANVLERLERMENNLGSMMEN